MSVLPLSRLLLDVFSGVIAGLMPATAPLALVLGGVTQYAVTAMPMDRF